VANRISSEMIMMDKKIIVVIALLISGFAFSQTTVTLEDQCNCEVLSGTQVTAAGDVTPAGADIGDIYVNTNTGTIFFWDGDSWELTSSDNQQLQSFTFDAATNMLTLVLERGGSVNVDIGALNTSETLTSIALGADGNSIDYTDELGATTNVPLEVGRLAFNAATRTLTYIDEEGVPTNISLPADALTSLELNADMELQIKLI